MTHRRTSSPRNHWDVTATRPDLRRFTTLSIYTPESPYCYWDFFPKVWYFNLYHSYISGKYSVYLRQHRNKKYLDKMGLDFSTDRNGGYFKVLLMDIKSCWANCLMHCRISEEQKFYILKGSYAVNRFSSVAQLCPTLCDPMNRSTPGLPVHHLESTQTHVHWVGDAISFSVVPFSSCPQSFPASGSFPMSWLFTSSGKVLELQYQSFQ